MQNQKALWFEKVGAVCIKEEQIQELGREDCLIKSAYSLISGGTERLVLSGKVPESMHDSMRVPYMKGSFSFPLTYGYSLVGEVIEGKYKGEMVHVMHPHCNYANVAAKDVTVLPSRIDARMATLISNTETVINAVWDSKVSLGDEVLVLGFGIIGQMLSCLLRHLGYLVKVIDPPMEKQVKKMGFPQGQDISKFDKVFNCTSSGKALQLGVDLLKQEGTLVELSWYGNQMVELNLGSSFHFGRKRIISSQVSNLPQDKIANWDYEKRKKLAIELIVKGVFNKINLEEVDFLDTPSNYSMLYSGNLNSINVIKY